MPIPLAFDMPFAELNKAVGTEDEIHAITDLLRLVLRIHNYPVSSLTGGNFASARLAVRNSEQTISSSPDLICRLAGKDYSEIILRDDYGLPVYGGYLMDGMKFEVLEEVENGHRVILVTHKDHSRTRHIFVPGVGYEPVF